MSFMITTVDNPYNPFTQNDEWTRWDEDNGYHTNAYIARIIRQSDDLSEADQEAEVNRALNEILEFNPLLYKRVKQP